MGTHSIRERWLACENCGAPIRMPVEGGTVACSKCQVELSAPPRPDTRLPRTPPSDELGRIARLRPQDGKPLFPPAGYEGLVVNNEIPPYKLAEAHMVWGASRRWVQNTPGDLAVGDRLTWLTMILRNTIDDPLQKRAMVEGALEVLSLPRQRQQMLGFLTRGAALEGDLESSRQWLEMCDPASEDLQADSAYRISKGMLETARGDWFAVLQVLGQSEEQVPVDDSMDPVAVVLRANALERSGNVQAAQAELSKYMARGNASSIEYTIGAMPREWSMCAQSIHIARADVRSAVGERAASSAGAGMGWIVMIAGGGVPAVLLTIFSVTGQFEWPMLMMLLFPVIFGGMGVRMILHGRRAKEIAQHGLHGRGKVLSVETTGTKINGTPLMQINVQVAVEGHPPVVASVRRLMRGGGELIGREVAVIWHPKYPSEVVLEV
jgi:hypothetical protein